MYQSEFCNVSYNEQYNVVFVEWKKFCCFDDYRKPLEYALSIIKEHKGCNYVADTRNGFENIKEDTNWVADYFMPKATEFGCKEIIFIIDKNNTLKDELEGQENNSSSIIKFRYIYDLNELQNDDVSLVEATLEDAELIWKMQIKAFESILEKYQDYETNPACETLEKIIWRLEQPERYFYIIYSNKTPLGAICVVDNKDGTTAKRISPLFVLPEHRNKSIAQKAVLKSEEIYGSENWELSTILQEKGNCYLYEKLGYKKTGKTEVINDKLTLVFYAK